MPPQPQPWVCLSVWLSGSQASHSLACVHVCVCLVCVQEVTPNNILLIGPSGCGKTELAKRLAAFAGAPFVL